MCSVEQMRSQAKAICVIERVGDSIRADFHSATCEAHITSTGKRSASSPTSLPAANLSQCNRQESESVLLRANSSDDFCPLPATSSVARLRAVAKLAVRRALKLGADVFLFLLDTRANKRAKPRACLPLARSLVR